MRKLFHLALVAMLTLSASLLGCANMTPSIAATERYNQDRADEAAREAARPKKVYVMAAPPVGLAPPPANYQKIVMDFGRKKFKDPASVTMEFVPESQKPCAAAPYSKNPTLGNCGIVIVNAKNSYGGYAGRELYIYVLVGSELERFTRAEDLGTNPPLLTK